MKKLSLLFVLIGGILFGQEFILTSENFRSKENPEKDYTVIEIPNTSKEELFKKVKKFVNSYYTNPKYISSEVENEQIVIDALGKEFKVYQISGLNFWQMSYKYELNFKDNKLMFKPFFKKLENSTQNKEVYLDGVKGGLLESGMFKKGEISRKKEKIAIENDVNSFIMSLKDAISKNNNEDW